jgi:hypothetical protein
MDGATRHLAWGRASGRRAHRFFVDVTDDIPSPHPLRAVKGGIATDWQLEILFNLAVGGLPGVLVRRPDHELGESRRAW